MGDGESDRLHLPIPLRVAPYQPVLLWLEADRTGRVWEETHSGLRSGSGGTCPVLAVSTSPGEPDSELQAVPSSKTGELKDMWHATSVMSLA